MKFNLARIALIDMKSEPLDLMNKHNKGSDKTRPVSKRSDTKISCLLKAFLVNSDLKTITIPEELLKKAPKLVRKLPLNISETVPVCFGQIMLVQQTMNMVTFKGYFNLFSLIFYIFAPLPLSLCCSIYV